MKDEFLTALSSGTFAASIFEDACCSAGRPWSCRQQKSYQQRLPTSATEWCGELLLLSCCCVGEASDYKQQREIHVHSSTYWCWRCAWLSGVRRLIHGANCVGGQLPACHCGGSGSFPGQVVWDFWSMGCLWIKFHSNILVPPTQPQWPRGITLRSAAARHLRLRVRIPAVGMDVCPLRVLSGGGLCDELITRPEESCRLWCVVYDLETSWMRRPWPELGRNARGKEKYFGFYCRYLTQILHTDIFHSSAICIILANDIAMK